MVLTLPEPEAAILFPRFVNPMATSVPAAQTTLIIRHIPESNPPSFMVVRHDGKSSQPIVVESPVGFPVEGRPDDLLRELRWYLEKFLDYPFPPETDHADRIQTALRAWGEQAFKALFHDHSAGRMFEAVASESYSNLHLQISSDDPHVLAWPWEALYDPELGFLAHTCQIERRLNTVRNPQKLAQSLPKDRVNILLVVARPYGERDVSFRSIARPLVELIEKEKLPSSVELLRPPTFDNLRKHLREKPGYYHILHFDGHGAYSPESTGNAEYTYQGERGELVFETEEGEPDEIPAEKLSALLRECAVPAMVLNACQSAMVGADSKDPFSSVAMALLRSGMRDVVAMAYSLYVSGAQQFLPEFYRRLFATGSMAVAVRAGRQQMWQHDKRACVRGEFQLQDWLLPVLYRQDPLDFSFAAEANTEGHRSKLPEELRREKNLYGFIGRDSAILNLERAMRRAPAGILIQGLGGVGKTTLARGFLQWVDQTGGLEYPPFWFSFQEIRSAEYVLNRMGEAVFGNNFSTLAMDKKIEALAGALHEHPFLIVWDNFESAAGIPGTAITANLPESDRLLLVRFLDELRGGKTKIIITSRSAEDWLGPQRRYLLPLGGLDGEERWEYCNAILHDFGKPINQNDKDLVELMNLLGGHPLAMRAILPRLEKMTAAQVLSALRSNLTDLKIEGDPDQNKLYATLQFVTQSVPEQLKPLLILVGLHEGFVDADYLEAMAKQVDNAWSRSRIDTLMQMLVSAGLLRDIGRSTYQMHPLLTTYLRSSQISDASEEVRNHCSRAFVGVMGAIADHLTPRELHEQRLPFHLHGQNFHYALAEAERLQMPDEMAAITQSLAAFAQRNRNFSAAQRLYEHLAEQSACANDYEGQAAAYHQLGRIAEEQWDLVTAEKWYHKSLAIEEELGNETGAATSYHTLGSVALLKNDLRGAEQWYRKSLAINEKLHNDPILAMTYHQLGMVAAEQRNFVAAEQWYRRSLAMKRKEGDQYGVATTYHQLGIIAQKQNDFVAAKRWYGKSLNITEKLGNEHLAASTYHQLGMIAQHQRVFTAAEQWYRKSLAIEEKQANEHGAAQTYYQLGRVAEEQRDFAGAEQWYRKSLAIEEKQGDEHGTASTYLQLGSIAQEQQNFASAEQWYRKALTIFERLGDEHGAAQTYLALAMLASMQGYFLESGELLIKSARIFFHDQVNVEAIPTLRQLFTSLCDDAAPEDQPKLRKMWQEAGLGELAQNDSTTE